MSRRPETDLSAARKFFGELGRVASREFARSVTAEQVRQFSGVDLVALGVEIAELCRMRLWSPRFIVGRQAPLEVDRLVVRPFEIDGETVQAFIIPCSFCSGEFNPVKLQAELVSAGWTMDVGPVIRAAAIKGFSDLWMHGVRQLILGSQRGENSCRPDLFSIELYSNSVSTYDYWAGLSYSDTWVLVTSL